MLKYLYLLLLMTALQVQAAPRILITTFEPFGLHKVNSTIEIADRIKEKLGQKKFSVEVCLLPVVYDNAALVAKKCYDQMNPKPDLVISLGASSCQITIESLAHNVDNSGENGKDNLGVARANQIIIPNGVSPLASGSFVADLYCSQSSKDRLNFNVSTSPGGFVCNNTAYLLGDYLRSQQVRFAFMHVPGDGCNTISRDGKIEKNVNKKVASIITDMISKLPLFTGKQTSLEQVFPYLPRSGTEIKSAQEKLKSLPVSDWQKCGLEFIDNISKTLN